MDPDPIKIHMILLISIPETDPNPDSRKETKVFEKLNGKQMLNFNLSSQNIFASDTKKCLIILHDFRIQIL